MTNPFTRALYATKWVVTFDRVTCEWEVLKYRWPTWLGWKIGLQYRLVAKYRKVRGQASTAWFQMPGYTLVRDPRIVDTLVRLIVQRNHMSCPSPDSRRKHVPPPE